MAEKCKFIDKFCYVCGVLVPKVDRHEPPKLITSKVKLAFSEYFKEPFVADRRHTPDKVCKSCYNILTEWIDQKGRARVFTFMEPMKWGIDEDEHAHVPSNCYACMNFTPMSKRNLRSKQYYDTNTSSKLPVPRPPDVKPPRPPSPSVLTSLTEETTTTEMEAAKMQELEDPDYMLYEMQPEVVEDLRLTQQDVDFLVAKLNLSQRFSEFLVSF